MAKITNYAIIDHIGSVEDVKSVYALAYKRAKLDGFTNNNSHQVWKMKEVIATMSNNRAKDDATKWAARHTKNPAMVYLICQSVDKNKYNIETAIKSWAERNIPVAIISELDGYIPPEKFPTYDFGLEISKARRCALIWADALGWTFSAPLIRNRNINTLEPWQKRPDREKYINQAGMANHITKVSTKHDKFLDAFRTIASEEECEAFFEHYKALYKLGLIDNDYLEKGWILCPHCNRPMREHGKCNWCDTAHETQFSVNGTTFIMEDFNDSDKEAIKAMIEVNPDARFLEETDEEEFITTYYDDSYKDSESDYLD